MILSPILLLPHGALKAVEGAANKKWIPYSRGFLITEQGIMYYPPLNSCKGDFVHKVV